MIIGSFGCYRLELSLAVSIILSRYLFRIRKGAYSVSRKNNIFPVNGLYTHAQVSTMRR
jgi:hypothetical protein